MWDSDCSRTLTLHFANCTLQEAAKKWVNDERAHHDVLCKKVALFSILDGALSFCQRPALLPESLSGTPMRVLIRKSVIYSPDRRSDSFKCAGEGFLTETMHAMKVEPS